MNSLVYVLSLWEHRATESIDRPNVHHTTNCITKTVMEIADYIVGNGCFILLHIDTQTRIQNNFSSDFFLTFFFFFDSFEFPFIRCCVYVNCFFYWIKVDSGFASLNTSRSVFFSFFGFFVAVVVRSVRYTFASMNASTLLINDSHCADRNFLFHVSLKF